MNNDRIALGKLLVSTATTTGNVDVPALNAGLSVLAAHKRIGSLGAAAAAAAFCKGKARRRSAAPCWA